MSDASCFLHFSGIIPFFIIFFVDYDFIGEGRDLSSMEDELGKLLVSVRQRTLASSKLGIRSTLE